MGPPAGPRFSASHSSSEEPRAGEARRGVRRAAGLITRQQRRFKVGRRGMKTCCEAAPPRPLTLQINGLPLGTHTNFCAVERVSHFPPNLILILPRHRDGFLRERGMDFLRVVSRVRPFEIPISWNNRRVGPSAQSILRLSPSLFVSV